jgi:hypothetical protein
MIVTEAHAINRTLPLLRFLPVSCGLLKWPLKVVKTKLPFPVC